MSVSKVPSPGPTPAFTAVHVCRALLCIGDEAPIGRIELSRKLGLGEGAVRTVIKHLANAKLLDTAKGGCVLTQRGLSLYRALRSRLSEIRSLNARQLAFDKASAAVLVRGSGRTVKRGIEQRDAAIRAGATGACTLICRKKELVMPMSENKDWTLESGDFLFEELQKMFAPSENDVITIASAVNQKLAEHGAMAAALTLLG
jgi:Mn-dependent DtxR family transcriptional regulator